MIISLIKLRHDTLEESSGGTPLLLLYVQQILFQAKLNNTVNLTYTQPLFTLIYVVMLSKVVHFFLMMFSHIQFLILTNSVVLVL